ncbi:DNA repair protein REV1 isoform X1 [Ziziphus jujuba]|uniref:DNA repair protein REV1 n=1 Tax=Ziziphus jujuba TaxID=326968 RepID=A0ABM3IWF4_ZIZJJ|nr:DNA repair protein REV1 isoform X1 [Ziziphus jujuba]
MSLDSSRSASSTGQKSKRSFNSISSNPSSSSNNKKHKKNTNQKTLGAVWGAKSPSSSRSSFRKSPFSDFGSYMVHKNRKLHNQFDAEASSSSHSGLSCEKPIFRGISIFVDGFTIPSSQELRGYMLKYGGRHENYFSRYRVTHIICSNLPDCKIKNIRSFSGGLPVVKPTWILDSVAANKLLSWFPYQLDQLVDNQPRLLDFFAPKNSLVSKDALLQYENEDTSFKGSEQKDESFPEVGQPLLHSQQISGESDDIMCQNTDILIEEPTVGSEKSCKVKIVEMSNFDAEGDSNVKDELQTNLHELSVSSYCSDNQDSKGLPSRLSYRSHSTKDPDFVENYFKNSRLHFIGTWRNRYRKHFPNLSKGFKNMDSNPNDRTGSQKTSIIHIDMDCFFVSVVIRNHPELKDKPVAVCHSDNPKGTAEISSANYPARDYGVRAGIFVRDAKALCPHLVIFPYNFEAYEEVADQFYNILHKHCKKVQAVSCDEAFLDVTDLEGEDPELLALTIRKEIFESTGCTASAGIAGNMLLSRLATRTAKPDGQCYIPPKKVDDYLCQLPIKELPGIGHVLEEKLKKKNVQTCGQLRILSKDTLQKDFGMKTGEMLWNYSRGIDNRHVGMIQETKSIGAEVNWGVRFKDSKDSQNFLSSLCKEVSLRLQGCGVQGRSFTLKIKKRRKYAEEPVKYMGCGHCENLSHSITVPVATDDAEVLQRITKQLFGFFNIDVKEIRGIGLQASKLESVDFKQGVGKNSLKTWLRSTPANLEKPRISNSVIKDKPVGDCQGVSADEILGQSCEDMVGASYSVDNNSSSSGLCPNKVSAIPPLCHLDFGVVENLPPELFSELNEIYGGKLVDFVPRSKGNSESTSSALLHEEGKMSEAEGPVFYDPATLNKISKEEKGKQKQHKEILSIPYVGGSHIASNLTSGLERTDFMPSSLSQVDSTVLQQLPEELRVDILEQIPAHRRQEFSSNTALGSLGEHPLESLGNRTTDNHVESTSVLKCNLWIGSPPKWVDEFKESKYEILKILAVMYYKSGLSGNLSSILRHTVLDSQHLLDTDYDASNEALFCMCELLKQYIELKIGLDIEEIYICFRLLQRFMSKSKFFVQVFDNVFPYLQASFNENYGGRLYLPLE